MLAYSIPTMTTDITPFETMDRLFEQLRRSMVEGYPTEVGAASDAFSVGGTPVRMEETETGYVVMADLPGFETEDLDVRFDDGVLTISGTHVSDEAGEEMATYRQRRVEERVSIPETVVVDDVSASYRNGVLEVHLPVDAETDDGHHIQIE